MGMTVSVRDSGFDPWEELRLYQESSLGMRRGGYGATAVFVGTLRDFNEGADVHAMTLEHYPGMTERHLEVISQEAARRWEILDSLVVHRVGELRPNDPIVLVAVWAAHRAAAFAACRYLIDELKGRAPFWKREATDRGGRWVEHNTPGG